MLADGGARVRVTKHVIWQRQYFLQTSEDVDNNHVTENDVRQYFLPKL